MESAWYKKICVIWCFKEEKEKKRMIYMSPRKEKHILESSFLLHMVSRAYGTNDL